MKGGIGVPGLGWPTVLGSEEGRAPSPLASEQLKVISSSCKVPGWAARPLATDTALQSTRTRRGHRGWGRKRFPQEGQGA